MGDKSKRVQSYIISIVISLLTLIVAIIFDFPKIIFGVIAFGFIVSIVTIEFKIRGNNPS